MSPVGQVFLAGLLTLLTVAVHGACTAATLQNLSALHVRHWALRSYTTKVLAIAILVLLMLTALLAEAWIWAVAYRLAGAVEGAEPALYFSVVTFTTLGYGDVVLEEGWLRPGGRVDRGDAAAALRADEAPEGPGAKGQKVRGGKVVAYTEGVGAPRLPVRHGRASAGDDGAP